MQIDLPPQYDPKSVESRIYAKWQEAGAFHAVPDGRPVEQRFSVVIPPPNVTGALHLGHAINGTIQDILVRYHRMRGDNTMWMPGIDHAGIATQAVVEKTIFEKEKKNRHDLGREELVRRIWEWKEKFGDRILNQLQSIGSSCDWERTRFTLDDVCARAVREAFFKMFKDGLIFRGKRLVNWDTHLQTAVADDEIYHETVKGQMTSIRYPVEKPEAGSQEPEEYLIVATTRPETMLGDTAVAVHPEDPRYKHLHGKFVIVPLVGRRIPIVADGLLVDPKFGTGVVKVTPAHDPNDYATGVRHGLEQINLLTADGKVNENGRGSFAGKEYNYTGLKFATAARKAVLADLETLGLIAEAKPHEHEVGHSDRSKTPIEPFLSDQWFVRMGDFDSRRNTLVHQATHLKSPGISLADGTRSSGLAQAAMDAVTDGRVKIIPDRYAKGYLDWLGQKRDWCISRQLWWGHRIPVWTRCIEINEHNRNDIKHLSGVGVFNPATPPDARWFGHGREQFTIDEHAGVFYQHVTVAPGHPDLERELEMHGFTQDPDVLDTWFSSALWPISTMGWPERGTSPAANDQLLPYYYPTSVLSTAREILTLWVARMVMFGLYCHGDVPFKNVYIHAVIQDGEGRPMKKSLGNGVDPVDIVASHGADALRFTLASMATETQDIRMPVVKDAKTGVNTSPKFDIGRNFANKIWNASRFILGSIDEAAFSGRPTGDLVEQAGASQHATPASPVGRPLNLEDRWILSRLNATITSTTAAINDYRFADLANGLYQFFWSDLCDWYLEIAKARIKGGDATVQSILLHCLRTSLQLLHPLMPFITEELWSKLPAAATPSSSPGIAIPGPTATMLITAPFPQANTTLSDPAAESQIAVVQQITSAIREIQNRYPAAKGKDAIVAPRNAELQAIIENSRAIIEPLAGIKLAQIAVGAQKPENAATAVLTDAQVFIAGVIDKTAETARLAKRRDELNKFIAGNKAKLSNEAFTAKAPEKVVQGLRDQLQQQETELAAVEKNLAELG
jgi:valyl-tRNA synthetase